MIEFNFSYNNNDIKYTVDILGRERIFVNQQLVAKPTNWFNSISESVIEVDGERLKLSRRIKSYSSGEYLVVLSNSHKIIDKQAQYAIELSMSGEGTVYRGEETSWLDEVKMPTGIINGAWALYFLIIFNSLMGEFIEDSVYLDLSGYAIAMFAIASIGLFLYWTSQALFAKPQKPDPIVQDIV